MPPASMNDGMHGRALLLLTALASPLACSDPVDDGPPPLPVVPHEDADVVPPVDDAGTAPIDADVDAQPDPPSPPACPKGTTDTSSSLAADVTYPAANLGNNPPYYPFGTICLPATEAGQGFYLESKAIRSNCTSYDACETSLEIKCFDQAGTQLSPQVWSAENFLNGARNSNLVARMLFRSTAPGAVVCKVQFFNHDHGKAGGSISLLAGSTFSARGPLSGTAATPDRGGGAHLSRTKPSAGLKAVAGWRMPDGMTTADFIGDIQVTECHVPYPSNATDPATQCTAAESGADSTVQYRALAVEENPDGTTCHVTEGAATTVSVDERTHHKMLYTQVIAPHTAGCANVWHFQVDTRWTSGRSFMVQTGPYGQGLVRGR